MNKLEARLARLERAVTHGLGIDLGEHDDPDQAAERAADAEAAVAANEEQLAATRAELEAPAATQDDQGEGA